MKQIGGSSAVSKAQGALTSTGATGWLGMALKGIAAFLGLAILLITLPAAPIIIYLTILFNVIKLMWGKLKAL
jgi:hypothetical protein